MKPNILFLCTGNSCRSQMAEGFARALRSDHLVPFSAGTNPHGLNPLAVEAMAELGIDISHHTSKSLCDIPVPLDHIITVCDHAHETCPIVPGAKVHHVGFEDPPRLAKNEPTHKAAMVHYRRVRDEIRAFVLTLPQSLNA